MLIQLLGFVSVLLLALQIYSTNRWNRYNQSLNQLDHSFILDNIKPLKDAGFNIKRFPISDSDLSRLLEDKNQHLKKAAENLLNKLEFFSISYNMNMFNKHYVFHAYSDDIIEVYEYLEPFMNHLCIQDETYYSEFKRCYKSIKKIEKFEIFRISVRNFFSKRKTRNSA